MKKFFDFIKANYKTLLFFGIVGLIGGFFLGIYQLDIYPEQMLEEIYAQGITKPIFGIVSAVQSAGYGIILGALGIFFAEKAGLWRGERSLTKNGLFAALAVSAIGGMAIILPDLLFFGQYSEAIMDSYATKPSLPFILASITYGAVIEEVMLRLFLMSLVAFVLYKLFGKKNEQPTNAIFIVANLVSALLFGIGHLPVTIITIGDSPLLIFRCILLNGAVGLLFGYLYRKYGLRYAMLAHGGCHVVSKLIWIVFI